MATTPHLRNPRTILGLLAAAVVLLMLLAAPQAQAATEYSTIQAKPPGGARDHRQLYVGIDTSSTDEQLRLYRYGAAGINPKLLWKVGKGRTFTFDSSGKKLGEFPSHVLTNWSSGNCLSYKLPWQNGTGVFQQASGCRGWALNAGKGRVAITDKTGQQNGFALEMIDKCLEYAGEFTAGAPVQLSACTGAVKQQFLVRLRVRDNRAV